MKEQLRTRPGVWPTMITPYTSDNKIDYGVIPKMVEWYLEKGCDGVFAVCQSSEMIFLTEDEKINLAKAVLDASNGRLVVVASGHTSTDKGKALYEIEKMLNLGVDAYILVTNKLDPENEGDETLLKNMNEILEAFPEGNFGLYECPVPYKRLLSIEVLKEIAKHPNIKFIKDTCCDNQLIRKRIEVLRGSATKLFNANAATLYDSIVHGGAGYSGVMANYHPDLIRFILDNYEREPEKAKLIADFVTVAGMIEMRLYPVSAKYHMNLEGIAMNLLSRSSDEKRFDTNARLETDSLFSVEQYLRKMFL